MQKRYEKKGIGSGILQKGIDPHLALRKLATASFCVRMGQKSHPNLKKARIFWGSGIGRLGIQSTLEAQFAVFASFNQNEKANNFAPLAPN